jgi:hypothetical protein
MALPRSTTGSLSPSFDPARPVRLAVKPAFAFALYRMISNHPERTFGRLRYLLGGDRPSQTARLARSPTPIQGSRLERRCSEGGIPTASPVSLTTHLL